MCGIAGVHRRNGKPIPKINTLVNNLLLGIEHRGHDATGFLAMMSNGKVQLEKRVIPASRFVVKRKGIHRDARSVLLHTRFATVGRAEDPRNAHPVASGTVAAVHNGTIHNHDEIFDAFKLPRQAEVDSEVIPALIHHSGWNQIAEALELLKGGVATAIVNTDQPNELVLARLRYSPLVYLVTDDMVIWASTENAIVNAWSETYGAAPTGDIKIMDEYTMIRINGKMTAQQLSRPIPVVTRQPKVTTVRPKVKVTKASKRAKKAHKKAARSVTPVRRQAPLKQDVDDLLRDLGMDTVKDLMREGFDRQSAMDMVFGHEPDWSEDLAEDEDDVWYRTNPEILLLDDSGNYEWR